MATSLLRLGRLPCVKCLQPASWSTLSRAPTAVASRAKSGGSKKSKKNSAAMDPIQKLFLDSIRMYSAKSQASGELVDAGADYQRALEEETAKLKRLYGGGDFTSFPEFTFTEPKLEETS